MTPNALDLTVAIIILLSIPIAYFRGIVRELFMLGGIVPWRRSSPTRAGICWCRMSATG